MAPELGDRAILAFIVARVEPDGPGPQSIDQQTVGAIGPRRKEQLPCTRLPFETGTTQIPIRGMETCQVATKLGRHFQFGLIDSESTLQVPTENVKGENNGRPLQPAKMIEQSDP